jgi:chromosome segregation ATPase
MKREDLEKLGLTAEQIDKIMAEHGKHIEKYKTDLTAVKTEADTLKKQLGEANQQIENFKSMDIEGVKKSADEYKAKFEQVQIDAKKQLEQLHFEHALTGALTGAKAKNVKAVRALLNTELLKLAEDGSISGLKDQLEKIQSENDFLFDSGEKFPKIVIGGNNKSVINDPVILAARKAAGLPTEEK